MYKIFTNLLFITLFFLQQTIALAEVSDNQLIDYIFRSTYKNFKELSLAEKAKLHKIVEQSYITQTLTNQQKLEVYSILLQDIGLDKPDAAAFKAIMLYEIEKYDISHVDESMYKLPRQTFIEFINVVGEKLIYDKIGLEKTAEDIRLESMGAYSKKKEISAAKRVQAIKDIYDDYLKNGIELENYKKVALQSFDNH